jgi:hypothetical protein
MDAVDARTALTMTRAMNALFSPDGMYDLVLDATGSEEKASLARFHMKAAMQKARAR